MSQNNQNDKKEVVIVSCARCSRKIRITAEHLRTPYYCC
jgi:hypothetical protein